MNRPVDEPLYPYRSLARRCQDVAMTLLAKPEASDRRVARVAGVSRELVASIRREMIRKSQIQSHHALKRVGADGKTYTRLPQPRRRKQKARHAIARRKTMDLSSQDINAL